MISTAEHDAITKEYTMLSATQREAAAKRLADASEKLAIVSAALGLYEGNKWAMLVAVACIVVSMVLTVRGAK